MAENKPLAPSPSKTHTSPRYSSPQSLARLSKSGRAFFVPAIRAFGTLVGPLFAILLVLILIAGCSSKGGADDSPSALMVETQTIALAYQAHGDVALARADLVKLGMANPEQWLLLTTETAISGGDSQLSAGGALALVKLTHDLGLRSTAVDAFASQNNLIATKTAAQPQAQAESNTAALVSALPAAVAAAPTEPPAPAVASEAIDPTPIPANTPAPATPKASPQTTMNVRGGPGTDYAVVASVQGGTSVPIVAKNPEGDWWQVQLDNGGTGWLYGPLVEISGETNAVVVAANIPAPPPTSVPAPTSVPQPTSPPAPSGPDFRMISKELWDVERNGGRLDGTSVNCGERRELNVIVLDAGGNRLNGVAVQVIYGSKEIYVTGAQGKGDGQVEFVLGAGQGVFVLRDADGSEASSDRVEGLVTDPREMSDQILIGGRYCTDGASCASFKQTLGCIAHYSWTVVFQRGY
ncbi:MAG: SH3 domain-containing protein [Caldilineaceae bacterium]|nr:SH3 domain-containing protein [Caldilineaceae bacterium]MBP8106189.1 SH3 domain-containing protein [Caldilineaceae bacterium]